MRTFLPLLVCLTACSLLAPSAAVAGSGALGVKTMREPLPAHEVERSLLLPKGWLELNLAYDHHLGVGAWSADGQREPFDDARWVYQTERATVTYGLSHQLELMWSVPVHQAHLTNERLGTDTKDMSLGDPRVGLRFEFIDRDPPPALGSNEPRAPLKHSAALELEWKSPAGKESPGTYIGGPLNVSGFVFTTGTPDLTVAVVGRRQFGPIALDGRLGYVKRFSGVTQYLIELENLQFSGRIKPGDQIRLDAKVLLQAGPVVPFGEVKVLRRGVTRTGTTSKWPNPSSNLSEVPKSDGVAVDADVGLMFQASRGVDITAHAVLPLVGEDLQFFPIEDLQPTLGPTYGASLQVRY
jgi:hypothetical protein